MDTDQKPQQEEQSAIDTSSPQVFLLPAPVVSALPAQRMPTVPQLAVAVGALFLVFAFSYLPTGVGRNKQNAGSNTGSAALPLIEKREVAVAQEPREEVPITAQAAYVWDVKNQKALYNKNAGTQLPLASLTKLMTVLVADEHLAAADRVPITMEALRQEGDSNLTDGEAFTFRDLANFTLITSSNDGAYALAARAGALFSEEGHAIEAFITAMNVKAEAIGLSQSYFTNPTGLDINGVTSGSYGSARDMAFLMEYLVLKHPDILEGTKEKSTVIYDEKGALFRAVNTNEVSDSIPGLVGSKTGFTGLAGGNLVIAYDAGLNRTIIISVLGSTREGRFSDVMTLIEETTRVISAE